MSTEDDNVAILRKAYAEWGQSKGLSSDHWLGLLADDVEWRSLAQGSSGMEFTSPANRREQVRGYLEGLARDWRMLGYEVDEMVAQGDRVVVLCRCAWVHKVTGKHVALEKVDVLRLRDGRITHFMEYYDTAKAMQATGLRIVDPAGTVITV